MSDDSGRLVVEDIRREFALPAGARVVLDGVSLTMSPGETVAVVGPSGSGKSTLLNIIGSLDQPTSGKVSLGAIDVTALDAAGAADYRGRRVGFVFQEHHLLPQCTALENVLLPTLALAGGSPTDSAERARSLLERMGLADRADSFPSKLSGGERQRVAVARALINGPGLLLCDEPTGSLDRDTAGSVAGLFGELVAERELMLVMVTHNMELAGTCSRVMELSGGSLAEAGG